MNIKTICQKPESVVAGCHGRSQDGKLYITKITKIEMWRFGFLLFTLNR